MVSRSLVFLILIHALLFTLDGCGPRCPDAGNPRLDNFYLGQAHETLDGLVIKADDQEVFHLESTTTFRFEAVVTNDQVAQHQTTIFGAYALSCVPPDMLNSSTKLEPESVEISLNKEVQIDSVNYPASADLDELDGIEFAEDGYNAFFVTLGDGFLQSLSSSDSLYVLTTKGNSIDGVAFEMQTSIKVNW